MIEIRSFYCSYSFRLVFECLFELYSMKFTTDRIRAITVILSGKVGVIILYYGQSTSFLAYYKIKKDRLQLAKTENCGLLDEATWFAWY